MFRLVPTFLTFLVFSQALAAPPKRVVIFGDSHIESGLGLILHEQFQLQGAAVSSYGLVGANPIDLVKGQGRKLAMGATFRVNGKPVYSTHATGAEVKLEKTQSFPDIDRVLEREKPQQVIFEFGDNLAAYGRFHEGKDLKGEALRKDALFQIETLLARLDRIQPKPKCFWISPFWGPEKKRAPYFKSDKRLQQVLTVLREATAGKCEFIDSTKDLGLSRAKVPPGKDGLHYDAKSYTTWGEAAFTEIQKRSGDQKQGNPCPTCGIQP